MKWLKYILYILITLYFLFCVALFFGQEKALFFPDTLPAEWTPDSGIEVWIPTQDDLNIHAVHVFTPNPKGVILYLHGNRGEVRRCLYQTRQFNNMGFDIFVPDYRGYGKSEGTIQNEAQMYQDAQAVYDYLQSRYEKIIIVGYSMGSGLASYLAANNTASGLLLIAPYKSLTDMKNRYLPFVPNFLLKYPFRTDLSLSSVKCTIAMVHGQVDEVIPFESALSLKDLYPRAKLTGLPNVGHRRVIFEPAIGQSMRYLISNM